MAAAPECPLACQAVAIPNWNRFAGREPAARRNRLRIGEHLCGTLITDDLAKESDDRRIRSDPSRCTVNARDFLEHLQSGNGIHLQSAVCLGHPRTHDPCIMKRSHRLRRQPPLYFSLCRVCPQNRFDLGDPVARGLRCS